MKPHPYKLRAYHNPENIDGSLVPDGWRFRYEDERIIPNSLAHCLYFSGPANDIKWTWERSCSRGTGAFITYIVPVA
jgi:hypothetical protein